MKNRPTKKYLRGKKSYENAMIHWSGKFPPFKQLTIKDQNYWSQDGVNPSPFIYRQHGKTTMQAAHLKFMNKLPAPYALKKYIIEYANKQAYSGYGFSGPLNTETEIDEAWDDMIDQIGFDAAQDIMCGDWETSIDPDFVRYCESKSVAIKDNYGNYIGITRYFGGGKHFCEYSMYDDSIANAYYLSCEEKEVLTIQRTWTKI